MQLADAVRQWAIAHRQELEPERLNQAHRVWTALKASELGHVEFADLTRDQARAAVRLLEAEERRSAADVLNDVRTWALAETAEASARTQPSPPPAVVVEASAIEPSQPPPPLPPAPPRKSSNTQPLPPPPEGPPPAPTTNGSQRAWLIGGAAVAATLLTLLAIGATGGSEGVDDQEEVLAFAATASDPVEELATTVPAASTPAPAPTATPLPVPTATAAQLATPTPTAPPVRAIPTGTEFCSDLADGLSPDQIWFPFIGQYEPAVMAETTLLYVESDCPERMSSEDVRDYLGNRNLLPPEAAPAATAEPQTFAAPPSVAAEPTAPPAPPTAIPAQPTAAPAQPTAIPATATAVPEQPTATPTAVPVAPTPAPATASCTPGYDQCIPPGLDVDCLGGSGDGPRYWGKVNVTGSDPYNLDHDNNGTGCENSP